MDLTLRLLFAATYAAVDYCDSLILVITEGFKTLGGHMNE